MKNTRTLSIIKISLMTVIIILCGWITIPAPIPFTMQTFGIYMAILLIGSKRAFLSVMLYLLLGIAGLPVFSGFSSGLGYISGPTGGFLLGFLLCPLVSLLGEKIIPSKRIIIPLLCAGTLLCYISGALWFVIVTNQSGSFSEIFKVLLLCIVPCIIPDCLKLISAYSISKKLKPIINKLNKD